MNYNYILINLLHNQTMSSAIIGGPFFFILFNITFTTFHHFFPLYTFLELKLIIKVIKRGNK